PLHRHADRAENDIALLRIEDALGAKLHARHVLRQHGGCQEACDKKCECWNGKHGGGRYACSHGQPSRPLRYSTLTALGDVSWFVDNIALDYDSIMSADDPIPLGCSLPHHFHGGVFLSTVRESSRARNRRRVWRSGSGWSLF